MPPIRRDNEVDHREIIAFMVILACKDGAAAVLSRWFAPHQILAFSFSAL
jgi:hypothetical protein